MSHLRKSWVVVTVGLGVALLAGCAPKEEAVEEAPEMTAAPMEEAVAPLTATATLTPGGGSTVAGSVTFSEEAGTVRVAAHVTGAPAGAHGFHLHQNGECTGPDFASAGDHFNPTNAMHGGPDSPDHHAGDLGNVEVGADGTGHLEMSTSMLTVAAGPNSVVGRSVVLHADPDDLTTQPSGNSGARIACGVIAEGGMAPMEGMGMESTAMGMESTGMMPPAEGDTAPPPQ
jgi:Cu-Zn family superoxide dismutase